MKKKDKTNYLEKLKSPHWQKKRLQILERSNFKCQRCGDSEETLHVHHRIYKKGKLPWEYEDSELMCLCEECHEFTHWQEDDIKEMLSKIDLSEYNKIRGFLAVLKAEYGDKEQYDDESEEFIKGVYLALGIDNGEEYVEEAFEAIGAFAYYENAEQNDYWYSINPYKINKFISAFLVNRYEKMKEYYEELDKIGTPHGFRFGSALCYFADKYYMKCEKRA